MLTDRVVVDDDGDGWDASEDCDDLDGAIRPDADDSWYDGIDHNCDGQDDFDADLDGYVRPVDAGKSTHPATGLGRLPADDCDDTAAAVHPGRQDVWYDGVDQNCDGSDDYDADLDGYVRDQDRFKPTVYVLGSGGLPGGDCDDRLAAAYPGAEDRWYDGVDADCARDDDFDADADGYVRSVHAGRGTVGVEGSGVLPPGDCDDADHLRSPAAPEMCNGVDDDCDGDVDGPESVDALDWYYDADGDGYGDGDAHMADCVGSDGYVDDSLALDCDDADVDVNPGVAAELDCEDGRDNDCDGRPDEMDVVCRTSVHPAGGSVVHIFAGADDLGCTSGVAACNNDEWPVVSVSLTHDFEMGQTEVTQGQWTLMMGDNPAYHDTCGDDCPVENVTWDMAADFANAMSAAGGLEQCYLCSGSGSETLCAVMREAYACEGYRLPTEAEWEFSARCGEESAYAGSESVGDVGWHSTSSGGMPNPVAGLQANACGLYDMTGNVVEWTADWYGMAYYGRSPGVDPMGPTSGMFRVIRGGGWFLASNKQRVADRWFGDPDLTDFETGFRVARTVMHEAVYR